MTPMMVRFFTLVGIALAAASMQLKARAEPAATQVEADTSVAAPQAGESTSEST